MCRVVSLVTSPPPTQPHTLHTLYTVDSLRCGVPTMRDAINEIKKLNDVEMVRTLQNLIILLNVCLSNGRAKKAAKFVYGISRSHCSFNSIKCISSAPTIAATRTVLIRILRIWFITNFCVPKKKKKFCGERNKK